MGLLDEAIREHLELKRRRGADPGEVAREERELLDPGLREGPSSDGEAALAQSDAEPADAGPPVSDGSSLAADDPDESHRPVFSERQIHDPSAAAQQETAELDMRRVLEEDGAPAGAGAEEPVSGVFDDRDGGSHGHVPGQESLPIE